VFNFFLVRLRQNLIFEKRKVEHFDLLFLSSFHFSFYRDDEILACVCARSAYIFGHLERGRERERERGSGQRRLHLNQLIKSKTMVELHFPFSNPPLEFQDRRFL